MVKEHHHLVKFLVFSLLPGNNLISPSSPSCCFMFFLRSLFPFLQRVMKLLASQALGWLAQLCMGKCLSLKLVCVNTKLSLLLTPLLFESLNSPWNEVAAKDFKHFCDCLEWLFLSYNSKVVVFSWSLWWNTKLRVTHSPLNYWSTNSLFGVKHQT